MRNLILFSVFAILTISILAADSGKIHVKIENLEKSEGKIYCSLHNQPEGFPRDKDSQFKGLIVEIESIDSVVLVFEDIPYGQYAITLYHDENNNGKMDYNLIGIPKEPYGFSNNPKITTSAPTFEKASFKLETSLLEINIKMN